MPKQGSRAEINSFVKGLITEASALNFPSDAIAVGENFDLHRDGTISRRLGMDYETGSVIHNTGQDASDIEITGINTFRWLSVAGDVDRDFLVVQVNTVLYFFDLNIEPLSSGLVGSIALTGVFPSDKRYSYAALEGRLVAVGGVDTIAIVEFNKNTNTFSVSYDRLLTRDVWGVEETFNVNYEQDPSYRGAMDGFHYYNLQNQSWGIPRKDSTGALTDPALYYLNQLGVAPSSSEQVWAALQFQPVATGQQPFERMYSNLWTEVLGAKVVTARGYFVIDVLRRGQSRTDKWTNNKGKYPELIGLIPPLPSDLTSGGSSCITDFAGRVFYGGFSGEVTGGDKRSPEYSNYIFFSQIVKQKSDFVKCYQEGDPTSRENSELVDTDGGFIRISGAKDILALRNLETSLIVIATNGVWSITGGNDYGFSATNYKVTKISSFGGISESSLVVEGGRAYFWSEDGIYSVGRNQFGDLTVDNITLTTIQKHYENIPNVSKRNSVGSYDLIDKKVRWVYKLNQPFTPGSVTFELVLDTALSAFSLNRINNISSNRVEVFGLFRSSSYVIGTSGDAVLAAADAVLAASDSVVVNSQVTQSGIHSTRYLALILDNLGKVQFTFSQYNNTEWTDWQTYDGVGVDAVASITSGDQTAGDSAVEKQIPYLVFHMYRTETGVSVGGIPLNQSSCLVRYQWNFSNSVVSNKWSREFQTYRYVKTYIPLTIPDSYDTGFTILTTKNKVRGMGRAFAMHIRTEPKKDCRIVGWSLTVNGNSIT